MLTITPIPCTCGAQGTFSKKGNCIKCLRKCSRSYNPNPQEPLKARRPKRGPAPEIKGRKRYK